MRGCLGRSGRSQTTRCQCPRALVAAAAAALIGRTGTVIRPLAPLGTVRIADQEWPARPVRGTVASGQAVRVTGTEAGLLQVAPEPPEFLPPGSADRSPAGQDPAR